MYFKDDDDYLQGHEGTPDYRPPPTLAPGPNPHGPMGSPAKGMTMTDQEKYFDGLDEWKPEDPDKEGPHFPDWQRDMIEKGPEPDPDDGIHMSEDEFIGHEPDQRQWGYRYKTELEDTPAWTNTKAFRPKLPPEWEEHRMGLGAKDEQGNPLDPNAKYADVATGEEITAGYNLTGWEKSQRWNRDTRELDAFAKGSPSDNNRPPMAGIQQVDDPRKKIPGMHPSYWENEDNLMTSGSQYNAISLQDTDTAQKQQELYGKVFELDDKANRSQFQKATEKLYNATVKGNWDPRRLARYAGRSTFVLGARRAFENTIDGIVAGAGYADEDNWWADPPEGWDRAAQYDPKDVDDLPFHLLDLFRTARNPRQMEEAKQRAAEFRLDQKHEKEAAGIMVGAMYAGRLGMEMFSSRGVGVPFHVSMRASGLFMRIDQTSNMAKYVARMYTPTAGAATMSAAQAEKGYRMLGGIRGAQQGLVGSLAEGSLTMMMQSSDTMGSMMTPLTGTIGATAGGFAFPGGQLKHVKFGTSTAKENPFHGWLSAWRAEHAGKIRELREAGLIDDPTKWRQGMTKLDLDRWAREQRAVDPEVDYKKPQEAPQRPVQPDAEPEVPTREQDVQTAAAQAEQRSQDGADAGGAAARGVDDGTVPGKDSHEGVNPYDDWMGTMRDGADDGIPQTHRQVLDERDITKGKREVGQSAHADRYIEEDIDTTGAVYRAVDPSIEDGRKMPALARRGGQAFVRQGVKVEKTTTVYMPNGKSHHKFAKDSGVNLRHAYFSKEEAARWSEDGSEIIAVRVPEGSKWLPGGLIDETAGRKDLDVLLGQGKAHLKKDGTWEWRPRAVKMSGEDHMLRAVLPEGGPAPRHIMATHNEGIDSGAITWEHPKNYNSHAGSAQVIPWDRQNMLPRDHPMHRTETNTEVSESIWDHLRNPEDGLERLTGLPHSGKDYGKNVGLTLAGRARGGGLSSITNMAPDLDEHALAMSRQDVESGKWSGQIGAQLGVTLDRIDDMKLNDWEVEGYTMFMKEQVAENGLTRFATDLDARTAYNAQVWEYMVYKSSGYDDMAKNIEVPSVKFLADKTDAWRADKIKQKNFPHYAAKTEHEYEPAGGRIHDTHEPYQVNQRINPKEIDDFEQPKDAFGNVKEDMVVEGAVKQNYQSQVQFNMNQLLGAQKVKRQDASLFAQRLSTIATWRNGKGLVDWRGATKGMRTWAQFGSRIRGMGVPQQQVAALVKEGKKLAKLHAIPEDEFLLRVLKFDPVKEVNIPLKNGSGSRPFRLMDGMYKNLLTTAKTEARDINGKIAAATTPRRNSAGFPQTKEIDDYDPKTGMTLKNEDGTTPKKKVRWTLNTPEEIDAVKADWEAHNAATGGKNDSQVAAAVELLHTMLRKSDEVPWEGLDGWSGTVAGIKLANSGWSAGTDFFLTFKNGINAIRELPDMLNFYRAAISQYEWFFKGQMSQWRADVTMEAAQEAAGSASASQRLFGGMPYQWGNSEYALTNAGFDNVGYALWKRAGQYINEVGMRWGGIVKLQDNAQGINIKGVFHNFADAAKKWKTVENMRKNTDGGELMKLMREYNLSPKELDQMFEMLNDPALKWKKTWIGGDYFDGLDENMISVRNHDRYTKLFRHITAGVNRETVLESTSGSRIGGFGHGIMPILTQFMSFPLSSGTQIARNWVKYAAEAGWDVGNGHGTRGAKMIAALGATFAMQGLGAVAIEIGKLEYTIANQSDAIKKKVRDGYQSWEFIANTFIDKGPVTAIIPLIYDNLWAPAINAPSWAGFDDWGMKRTGPMGIVENLAFGNPAAGLYDSITDIPKHLQAIRKGKATVRDYQQLNPFGGLFVWQKVTEEMLKFLGADPGEPRKFKELQKKNPWEETQKSLKKLKYLKRIEKGE